MKTEVSNLFKLSTPGQLGRTPLCRVGERDHALLDAAKCLFLERGFAQVSMELIARTAGVAVRTIYIHFGGKHGLLCKIIERECERDTARSTMLWDRQQNLDLTLSGIAFNLLCQTLSPVSRSLFSDALAARDFQLAEKIDPVHCGPWRRLLEHCFATAAWGDGGEQVLDVDVMCDMFLGCVMGAHSRALMATPDRLLAEGELKAIADSSARKFLTSVHMIKTQIAA
jgi:AcrR family transcriptional regulator